MARFQLDRFGAHPFRHEAFQIGINCPILRRHRVETRLCARRTARCAEATASDNVVSGFCTEVTLRRASWSPAITSVQQDPSANKPCTNTTLRALTGGEVTASPRVEMREAAAPAAMVKGDHLC